VTRDRVYIPVSATVKGVKVELGGFSQENASFCASFPAILSRPERKETAKLLAAKGCSTREIA
jgi:hypothetical protein